MVVAREPPGCDLGLTDRDGAGPGLLERRLPAVRQPDRLAAVLHRHGGAVAAGEGVRRSDDELVLGLVEARAAVVHRDRRRAQQEVEVEPAQPLLGDERDRRLPESTRVSGCQAARTV
jgi:hypothetical protein